MFGLQDETIIKLHTAADGTIWYARGVHEAVSSEQTIDEFLRSSVVSGFGLTFRLLGVPQNAELICALFLRRHKGEVRAVEVAGPNMLPPDADAHSPQQVIMYMRAAASSPACGGWHSVTMSDYPLYALIARDQKQAGVFDDIAYTYLKMHPLYKALRFIPTLEESSAVKMLLQIVDPRWYVEARRPDRIKKLELYMGLTPTTQRRVSDTKSFLKRSREFRCAAVLSSWKTTDPAEIDDKNPANFLYRIWQHHGGGPKGDLRASQAFLRYTVANWLSSLESRRGPRDDLFVPAAHFRTPAEIEAYRAYMSKTKE